MRKTLRRLAVALVVAVGGLLLGTVAIAKVISLVDSPHDAARAVESAMGTFWPVIVVAVALAAVGFALYPVRRQ